jgi:hypothetical protein
MAHGDAQDKDGNVSFYEADAQRLDSYRNAEQRLSQFQAPIFIHVANAHERFYLACLDGTGNDETKPQFGPETNVARISDQIQGLHNSRIKAGYVPGPGTQDGLLARTRDGITGGTYDERVEKAYKQLIDQAKKWHNEDPQAQIRVVGVGFSRGGSEEAGLARMIDERGIQNPDGAIYTKNHDGMITHVQYTKPPLIAPGHVAQAELLFDPVSTGAPMKHDRRPPPSVISGLQIIALDERRSAFRSDHIIDPGATADGRFLGVTVAGAHSDVGGSYARDGLGIRSENLAIDYLNAFSDTPFLTKQAVPDDPRISVVHRSEQAFPFDLMPTVDRATAKGYNELLVPKNERRSIGDPLDAEPRNETLSHQFEWHPVKFGALPAPAHEPPSSVAPLEVSPAQRQPDARSPTAQSIDRLYEYAKSNDAAGMHAVTQDFMHAPAGQVFQHQVQAYGQAVETHMQLQAQQVAAQQAMQQSAPMSPGPTL